MESQLNDIVESNSEEWKLKDRTVKAITTAKGEKKVSAFASAIRTLQFMQRYESELQQRDERLRVSLAPRGVGAVQWEIWEVQGWGWDGCQEIKSVGCEVRLIQPYF